MNSKIILSGLRGYLSKQVLFGVVVAFGAVTQADWKSSSTEPTAVVENGQGQPMEEISTQERKEMERIIDWQSLDQEEALDWILRLRETSELIERDVEKLDETQRLADLKSELGKAQQRLSTLETRLAQTDSPGSLHDALLEIESEILRLDDLLWSIERHSEEK